MRIAGNSLVSRTTARSAVSRRVEKANSSGALGEDSLRQPVQPIGFVERRRSRRQSRFDTRASGNMERNGTSCTFVAQVLGQILDAGRQSPIAAARVYARASSGQKGKRTVGVL